MKTLNTNIEGTMYPKGTLFLRVHIGTITRDETGEKYEASYINGVTPCVESKQTGKYFLLDWRAICEAADKAGINQRDEQEQP